MQVPPDDYLHLTYCTNIHAADGWPAVFARLREFAPALKARLSPEAPFGIGLRLSARDLAELEGPPLIEFRNWLDREGLYVAIINGFPYGPFHGTPVKANVYAPDWRDVARVQYTSGLIDALATLVPEGLDGGVSTVPLSYKAWMPASDRDGWRLAATNVARIAEKLVRLKHARGISIHLDIEPEPDCALETTEETVGFFEDWLLPIAAPMIAATTGASEDAAREEVLDHVRVCLDCCHMAVEFETPEDAVNRLRDRGIRIGRVQLSSGLKVTIPPDAAAAAPLFERLRGFDDTTYLHQVVERHGGQLVHRPDLGDAIRIAHPGEWRVHFHVPLFTGDFDGLGSTQSDVGTLIRAAARDRFTRHLEIETYTWDVLPGALKVDLLQSIAREYEWVLACSRQSS